MDCLAVEDLILEQVCSLLLSRWDGLDNSIIYQLRIVLLRQPKSVDKRLVMLLVRRILKIVCGIIEDDLLDIFKDQSGDHKRSFTGAEDKRAL